MILKKWPDVARNPSWVAGEAPTNVDVEYNFKPNERDLSASRIEKPRPSSVGTDYKNPFLPTPQGPKGGIDSQRGHTAIGTLFENPSEAFKDKHFHESRNRKKTETQRPVDNSRARHRSISAYRKVN